MPAASAAPVGIDVAYYLIHSMGRRGDSSFSQREQVAARNFARMAKVCGVGEVVYLGGLGDPRSRHLRSRHETARTLAAEGPPLTNFRAEWSSAQAASRSARSFTSWTGCR